MSDIPQSAEFWLPPEFFTGDGILSDPPKPNSNFKSDFPAKSSSCYYSSSSSTSSLSSSAFSSPVESVLGSVDTDSDEEDESLAGLTRGFPVLPNQSPWERMMKMNGLDERRGQVGPTHIVHSTFHENKSFYVNQFPFNQVEPKKEGHVTNLTCGSIFGRPSMDDLIHRQIRLQHISQHRNKVLSANHFKENVQYVRSSLGLPYLARPYPLGEHQMNKMSTLAPPGMFGKKQACAGTGVFIPRPFTNPLDAPNKSGLHAVGRHNAHHPPRFYQALNKNSTLTTAQAFMAPHHDAMVVRSNTIQIQNMPGLPLDGFVKHEQCLPREWPY